MISGNRGDRAVRTRVIPPIVLALWFCGTAQVLAAEKVLYSFQGGNDGKVPYSAPLIADGAGNLYGTTSEGGSDACEFTCGTVFELSPGGVETLLHTFQGGSDGEDPESGLLADGSGNLYGTTVSGGSQNCSCGTVFRIAPDGKETVLYAFQGGSDGAYPGGNLVEDADGNLFGTTYAGGNFNGVDCSSEGCGAVFELKPDGTELALYSFQASGDGYFPAGGIIRDAGGNLYGTTIFGGSGNCQGGSFCGTVFKVTPNGTETLLHSFQGGSDGEVPESTLLMDVSGNLYGTTVGGGAACTIDHDGCGTVFRLAPDGTESVLYAFQAGNDGYAPYAGVIMDKADNLYGTTGYGGGAGCKQRGGCGTVFKVTAAGNETVLYAFAGRHGSVPNAGLLLGKHGYLYGTTTGGGTNKDGVVFRLKK